MSRVKSFTGESPTPVGPRPPAPAVRGALGGSALTSTDLRSARDESRAVS